MKGRLFNAADGWIISYKSEILGSTNMIPLHPKDVESKDGGYNWNLSGKEGSEIEFSIVSEYSSDGKKVIEYAKLKEEVIEEKVPEDVQIETSDENEGSRWDEVFTKWMRDQSYSKTIDGLQEYLEKKYFSPEKK